jgi:AraC family transcriptional regulator, melibiose operon regulatory protein
MPRPDRHDEIEINYLDRGTLTYLLGGQRVVIRPRCVNVFWAAVPHQIVSFEDVSFYYVLTVPFGWVLQWGLPENLLSALLHGRMLADRDEPSDAIDPHLFERWHWDLERDSDANYEIVTLEVRARLLRLARQYPASDDAIVCAESAPAQPQSILANAEAMADYVARNYTSRLRVEEIAACTGLNADYAGTLFRKVFGMTLTDLITRHRIAHAQRQLVTTDDQIIRIAQDSGFDSLSRFNRAFKELSGMTPREFRKTTASGVRPLQR